MEFIRQKLNSGNIGIVQLVSWGIGLATFAASITYASYSKTQNDVVELKVQQATLEQQVANIKENTDLLVKELINKK